VKSDGIQTLVMKLRSVHLLPGRSLTRVDFFGPPAELWRTILRFLEKGFGTGQRRYKRGRLNQTLRLCLEREVGSVISNTRSAKAAGDRQKFRNGAADSSGDRVHCPNFGSVGKADRRRRMRWESYVRRIFAAASRAGNRERRPRTVFRFAEDRQPI